MGKTLIVFGSTTGNTEATAEEIERTLQKKGHDTTLLNVVDATTGELEKDYDLYLFGCSTWGEDEIELQDDFTDFYDAMDDVSMAGRKAAVFGCGDSSYTHFCGAVDAIEERIKKIGGNLITEGLKIDGEPDDATDEIKEWAETVSENM